MTNCPKFEFHVSRAVRDKYRFDEELFSWTGNVLFANVAAVRKFANQVNTIRKAAQYPDQAMHPGSLNAMGLIDEALHAVIAQYRREADPKAMTDALPWFEQRLGREALDKTLLTFTESFPGIDVYRGKTKPAEWLQQSTDGTPHRAIALEEMMMLWLANANPAFAKFCELFDDVELAKSTVYPSIHKSFGEYFETRPRFGPDNQNLVAMLRAPALASPDSLEGQLAFIEKKWTSVLGDMIRRMLTALDILKEEELAIWMQFHPREERIHNTKHMEGDSSAASIPHFTVSEKEPEYERFSPDVDWMPKTVMLAKSSFVWLDQLSKFYQRRIHRLDEVPDEELNAMARRGFNALWLIGVWERSKASQRIKQLTGNPEAAASAYSLYDYTIAHDLGGEEAYIRLRDRAWQRGIRLGTDMVPNHMGIDSKWIFEHPEWFLSVPYPPYPAYTYHGPDVSDDGRVEVKIEDHYYNRTDAAVTFMRRDRWSNDTRFIYHGNDGTSFPWNDTAQLNYLNPEVREAVIQQILHVARLSPIIRFDAAMTLTKQHYQRLWFPQPGSGGGIPSRAEHGLTKPEFDRSMPNEFWREVVDRVAVEVPGTLLLAEAFWLLEGYFVRTLGMHRVYNSAFMNMLRDEENANYRSVIKNTIEFDPDILKRYVNFMNNPDERTAVDQFGKGDKYFGIAMMMSTIPGLPMFGHGQIEGFNERYGMEYRKAYHDETPDNWLVARHEREISPLLHRRALFAEVQNFLLYDFYADQGHVDENVFAYSNRLGNDRALIVFNNKFGSTSGWVRISSAYAEKTGDGGRNLRQKSLSESFGVAADHSIFLAVRDAISGLEYLHSARDLAEKGLHFHLSAYQYHVFLDWRDLRDDATHPWSTLCHQLAGRGVSSLEDALRTLQLEPVHDALLEVIHPVMIEALYRKPAAGKKPAKKTVEVTDDGRKLPAELSTRVQTFLERARQLAATDHKRAASTGAEPWNGDIKSAVSNFEERLKLAQKLGEVEKQFSTPWPSEAHKMLPTAEVAKEKLPQIWAAVAAWSALLALGEYADPTDAECAASRIINEQRLREPIAEALQHLGLHGDERWRVAARIRTILAHKPWAPGSDLKKAKAPFSWMHDPEVAWLIGVHAYQDVRYFNKESFEQLLWWMALPALLTIAAAPKPDPTTVETVEEQIEARTKAAADVGYQLDGLFDAATAVVKEKQPSKA
ncbi:alpha amylase [Candidatus Koribacter versatilis Ellin345]|uniref:Alpha amylase n=1 Tax=Koribacter versatilis (strain Ellin345) TaxID=204669 RepID=Q1IRK6_KORVE|nr:alpha-amylase family glycosyl hydrolase [Candidatus Koribacter versatilis]ABF40494.1 alpha amylase [Candidatus Koribacter versatilis Ellin345]